MLNDTELSPEIILPLKLQGVADITDGAIVCRLKITARPARASWVQREALKRVYAALEGNGIAFASGAVTSSRLNPTERCPPRLPARQRPRRRAEPWPELRDKDPWGMVIHKYLD